MYTDTENDEDWQRNHSRYLVGMPDILDRRDCVLWDLGFKGDKLGLAVSCLALLSTSQQLMLT